MALPISIPYTFATATGSIPLSQLDNNFSTLVSTVNTIGSGSTPLSNVSITGGTISGLSSPIPVASGGSGQVTLTANAVVLGNGTNAVQTVSPGTAGNVLTSDGTTWSSAASSTFPGSIQNAISNLKVQAASDTSVTVTADAVTLKFGSLYYTAVSPSLSISTASTGANGLDTGTIANSTWYSVWVIYNGSTVAGLLSTSATSPTLPSGYNYKARVGWVRYATGALARTLQYGNRAQYVVTSGSQTPNLPIMSSGVNGNYVTPTWVAVAWANYAPSTTAILLLALGGPNIAGIYIAAPNNSYGGAASTTNPPMYFSAGSNYSYPPTLNADMTPESANVYWASNATQGFLLCRGWIDNL